MSRTTDEAKSRQWREQERAQEHGSEQGQEDDQDRDSDRGQRCNMERVQERRNTHDPNGGGDEEGKTQYR